MTLTFKTFLAVIYLSPGRLPPTKITPQMYGSAEILVARIPKFDLVHLTRLKAYRCCAGIALQGLMILKSFTIFTAFT